MALTGAMQAFAFVFSGKLNRNGWPVPVLTPVEELSCRTPVLPPPHSVFFFCAFFFFSVFVLFLFSALAFAAAAATAEGDAL